MPKNENLPVEVTLTVKVDGHTLVFTQTGRATGGRFYGADPRAMGYSSDVSLENSIRDNVGDCIEVAAESAVIFLERAYPVRVTGLRQPGVAGQPASDT